MRETATKWRVWLAGVVLVLVLAGLAWVVVPNTGRSPIASVVTWFWKLDYWALPVRDRADLAALHRNSSGGSREQCVACHGDKTSSKLVLHRIHLESDLLPKLQCHDCHQRINIATRGNRAVVTWVDVGFCKKCHSAFPGLKPGSKMRPEYFKRDCTTCHKDKNAPKHAQPYLPRVIPASECKGCHGGRVLPSSARHEQGDWLQVHGAEALAVGADTCYRCHDFGLKFCDGCHGKKPPSHLPAERWRAIHPEAARADTRVCYSCHRTSFCKRCHVNHEAGWMQEHPEFVQQNGASSCTECHSSSACSYCHMNTLGSVETTTDQ